MIVFAGFDALVTAYKTLPDSGWIYINDTFDIGARQAIQTRTYYLSENEDEEMECEEHYGTFLESPIFKAVIANKLEYASRSTNEALLTAVIYYIEKDAFLD